MKSNAHTTKIAIASMLGALSALLELIPGPPFDITFPLYSKISWDFMGVPIMICLLLYGVFPSLYTTLIGTLVIFLRGNVYGGIFKLIAEVSTIVGYSSLRKGVLPDTIVGTLSRVVAMHPVNYYLLQSFYGIPEGVVVGLLPSIAVFNVTQALINIVPAYIVYLRLKKFVQSTRHF